MPVKADGERSVTSAARRSQIVAATISVVASEGLAQASFARIAREAGLSSTRLISYHFAGREDLVLAVVQQVLDAIGSAVGHRVRAEVTAAGRLRSYISASVAFIDENRAPMTALLQVALAGALPAGTGADDSVPHHLEAILREGQAAGEFRDFDPRVVALAVQRSLEGLPLALQAEPDLDCAAFGRELVTLFDLATRRPG